MELDIRLKEVAKLVPAGSRLADIGTDHGYLLIYLTEKRKISYGIGCDLRPGPLTYARKNVAKFLMSDRIELRLGDGLEPLHIGEADGAAICGMGGGTMRKILENQKEIWNSFSYLILQPQSDSGILRKFLAVSGWRITKERLTESQGRLYEILFAVPGTMDECPNELIWELGPLLWAEKHPLLSKRISELEYSAGLALKGIEKAKETATIAEQKRNWKKRLDDLKEARKWLQN